MNAGRIKFTQLKGRNRKPITLKISIHPELQKIIDVSTFGDPSFLVREFG